MTLILTINSGSSSLKFAAYTANDDLTLRTSGEVDGLGASPRFTASVEGGAEVDRRLAPETAPDPEGAVAVVLAFLNEHLGSETVVAVGHRVVHGGADLDRPVVLDAELTEKLAALDDLAPLHQPHNLAGVRAARAAFPHAVQVACFDTAFHRSHPYVADTYALPRSWYEAGVRRYGFHGISYEYVTAEFRTIAPEKAAGRVVIAHLGNGASMCAVKDGRSIGTTMGYTALDGLPMGTRCGQLDPGVVLHMLMDRGMSVAEVEDLLYKDAGLKGMSGLSNDMRVLEASDSPDAAHAIDYFVHRLRREIGAMAAILEGVDAIVFCGGIGENAWRIRERACAGFEWMGVRLDPARNRAGETTISADGSPVSVHVIRTDEQVMIARHTARLLSA